MNEAGKLIKLDQLSRDLDSMQAALDDGDKRSQEAGNPSYAGEDGQHERADLLETVHHLATTVEELRVAEDEIRQQNEELQAAHQVIVAERLRYRELFDFAPEAYLLTDIYGLIHEANLAASELLNVPANALAGKPLAVFITSESKQAFYHLLVTARDVNTSKVGEFKLRPRHRQAIDAEFTVLTTRDAHGMPLMQRWLIRDITHRKQIEAELLQSRQQTQAFASNIQTAREDERTRVAREIHDELGQTLTGLRLDIGMAKKQVPEDMTELHAKLEQISATVVETIETVRRIMTDLRPSVLDEAGLVAAMEWQCRDFKTRTGIHCRLLTKVDEIGLDRESTSALFRLTQEMLTNAARHSNATRVTIELKQSKQWVQLEVRDNGRGITEEEINNPYTAGLLGMRERVRLLNGEITFQGMQGRGTHIRVKLPRQSTPQHAKDKVIDAAAV